ncbi:sigma-70 family RNA polymerase sigma factor [Vulgatibacter incomptus]|uniref:RNA polymerase sigma factor for flagellar operon n=1 Tax=Vulgatibacter incomptus TaxID=1391653 RepID=A0A0K1PHX4_9BACT|nr:FliA/WhiG family RNA polymerase sigma factor [Vulgatibacter incomptus]AKU93006.1 RNA polymerase sigma factor for flagellar operon [Vulgatibacter incomptus]
MRRVHALYATEGGDARALITRYGASIDRHARRLAARTGDATLFDDLWSAGAVGLLDAARRFDAGRDIRFESYAEHRIRGAMIDELRRHDHLPRRLRDDLDRVHAARTRLEATLGREPTLDELAAALGIEADALAEMEALTLPPLPLMEDAPLRAEEVPADERIVAAERSERLAAAIARLPERLQLVMSLLYAESLTNKEVAGILEVSEARVSQLHSDAIKRLRADLASES